HAFSNALSPVQAGVVLEALRVVRSDEGDYLRARSRANIAQLRAAFEAERLHCYGRASNIVPVGVGDERLAKWTGRALEERGLIANLVEYPAVARAKARFRFQVMATHTREQIDLGVSIFRDALAEARTRLEV
ncbi:MAG TPA: aminotransferase class I/II-fold pyridoxal phosphate-dependent enzyme, partial [Pyrinomonadaceae bacterium]|nr:aminotransferase class I/II-fold pyridoxal phosphate-dependent enzyme [Pyrinomonadaceae bacterium]